MPARATPAIIAAPMKGKIQTSQTFTAIPAKPVISTIF
jgi:hypothetical protein